MEPSRSFRDLIVWQKAHAWVLGIYRLARQFPKDELFGLTSQLRRAAVSVPANIVEGFHRRTKPDKIRFFNISHASLEESRYYLILAQDLGYGSCEQLLAQCDEVSRMIDAYSRTMSRSTGAQ
jgi:four helix bundle protein